MALVVAIAFPTAMAAADEVPVWEKVELTFPAGNQYANPYTNVEVWVDLKGPGFDKRCYGFWDGSNIFKVRVLASHPGEWSWRSGSNQKDSGLNDQNGRFTAVEWSKPKRNPCRLGEASSNRPRMVMPFITPMARHMSCWVIPGMLRPRSLQMVDDDKERPSGRKPGSRITCVSGRIRVSTAWPLSPPFRIGPMTESRGPSGWTKRPTSACAQRGWSSLRSPMKSPGTMACQGHEQRRWPRVPFPRKSSRLRTGLSRTWTASTPSISNISIGKSITSMHRDSSR